MIFAEKDERPTIKDVMVYLARIYKKIKTFPYTL